MFTGIWINDVDHDITTFSFFPAVVADGTFANAVDGCLGSVCAVYDGSECAVDVEDGGSAVGGAGVVVEAVTVVTDEPAMVYAVVNAVDDAGACVDLVMMQSTVEFVAPEPVEPVVPVVVVVVGIGSCCLVQGCIGTIRMREREREK